MEDSYRLNEFSFQGRGFVYGRLRFEGQQDSMQTCILKESNGLIRLTVPFELHESEVSNWFFTEPESTSSDEDVETAIPQRLWLEEVETGKIFTLLGNRRSSISIRNGGLAAYGTIATGLVLSSDFPGDFLRSRWRAALSPSFSSGFASQR